MRSARSALLAPAVLGLLHLVTLIACTGAIRYEEEQAKKAEEEAEDLNTRCERLASSLPSVEDLGGAP